MGVWRERLDERPVVSRNETSRAVVSPRTKSAFPRYEGLILAGVVFVAAIYAGYELVFHFHEVYGDAMSRVLPGLYIVWGGEFHLAAIGFYWSPLVVLLAVPFALLRSIWPPLMQYAFTANVLSACFAALGVYHMDRLLWRFGLNRPLRVFWVMLYAFNPLIFLYSSNGMSDGMLCAVIIACVDNLSEYIETERLLSLVVAGSWLAAAFMVRYEAVPIGAGLGVGLAISIYLRDKNWKKAEGVAISFLFPVVMAGLIWILLAWIIMKDPLYFLNSKYSNSAQIKMGGYNYPQVMAARHNLVVTIYQVFHFTDNFWPYVPAVIVTTLLQIRKKPHLLGIPLVLASFGVPVLQAGLLYTHRSADWDRFFIYYVPFGVMLCGYALSLLTPKLRMIIGTLSVALFLSADYLAFVSIQSPVWGNGENGLVHDVIHSGSGNVVHVVIDYGYITSGRLEAAYLNSHPDLVTLVSAFQDFGMMPFIQRSNSIVFNYQADFDSVLYNPRGRVNAILDVSNPTDQINVAYPTMYSQGLPWLRLIHEFPNGDKLFRVLSDAP